MILYWNHIEKPDSLFAGGCAGSQSEAMLENGRLLAMIFTLTCNAGPWILPTSMAWLGGIVHSVSLEDASRSEVVQQMNCNKGLWGRGTRSIHIGSLLKMTIITINRIERICTGRSRQHVLYSHPHSFKRRSCTVTCHLLLELDNCGIVTHPLYWWTHQWLWDPLGLINLVPPCLILSISWHLMVERYRHICRQPTDRIDFKLCGWIPNRTI